MDYQVNGSEPVPLGNRDRNLAPHGVYRCAGDDDRWIAVEVHTSEQWRSLCEVIGRADLGSDSSLNTAEGRKAREDELDRAIGAWTAEIRRHGGFPHPSAGRCAVRPVAGHGTASCGDSA